MTIRPSLTLVTGGRLLREKKGSYKKKSRPQNFMEVCRIGDTDYTGYVSGRKEMPLIKFCTENDLV